METINQIFGDDQRLTTFSMCMRAVISFIIALLLLRISGRRSFGMQTAVDNVVAILLGAVLARGVVGASPFLATIAASATFALLHRLCGWLAFYSRSFGRLVKGDVKLVYTEGKMVRKNMRHCMVSERDIMEGIRIALHRDNFSNIDKIYVERDGKISVVTNET
jgi:uncharacterized membrane protein YcaP (DUF421 family)